MDLTGEETIQSVMCRETLPEDVALCTWPPLSWLYASHPILDVHDILCASDIEIKLDNFIQSSRFDASTKMTRQARQQRLVAISVQLSKVIIQRHTRLLTNV